VRFSARLLVGALAILALNTGILLFATERWIRDEVEQVVVEELERETRLAAAAIFRDSTDFNQAAHRLGVLIGRRVTLIAPDGRVLGDSDFDDEGLARMDNHSDRPEVADATETGTGVSKRFSASTRRPEVKVAIRAWPGVVRLSAPVDQVNDIVREVVNTTLAVAIGVLLLGVLLVAFVGQTLARPLRSLASSARTVAAGGAPTFPSAKTPEMQELVGAFRSMHEELTRRISQLGREREEVGILLSSMVEGVILAKKGGEIVVSNEAFRSLLGIPEDEPTPNLRDVFTHEEAKSIANTLLDGTPVYGQEISLDDKEILVNGRPLAAGGAVLSLMDITDIRRLQLVRRDFVANVSHELKTPLTSVVGYAETLLRDDPDAESRQKFLTTLHANGVRMQRLVDDLLDLARVESGAWEPNKHPTDIGAAARDAWEGLGASSMTGNVDLAIAVPEEIKVTADQSALRQVLGNLFENAVRHTPDGGTITVTAQDVENGIAIAVQDNGIGIASDHLPRIFERFYRADPARSRQEGGTGLGLAIVKHLMEAHGGQVSIESELGVGTTVRLFFPAE
jgi:two-component system phosphate regulon sensor histidine kinase PhoR